MDFLGFVFTPDGVIDLYVSGIVGGSLVGALVVLTTLFYGRSRS